MRTRPNFTAGCLAFLAVFSACSKAHESNGDKPAATAKRVEAPAPPPAQPCDGPEMADLIKQLRLASGLGVDFTAPGAQAAIDAAIASIKGKRVAFTNCKFKRQGNDEVSFAPRADSPDEHVIACKMAGGEAGNSEFLRAAGGFDMKRLLLDVVGVVDGSPGPTGSPWFTLTSCNIKPHE